jgi:hypothetical protein
MSLLLLCYISLLSTGKDCRYRPTGIPARTYHVELTAEVVPLCGEKEAPTPADTPRRYFLTGVIKPVSEFL